MCLPNKITPLIIVFALAVLASCGSSPNRAVAPPTGAFSNSNLNGTYVFSFSGNDFTDGVSSFFAVAGTLTANGSGSFTGGVVEFSGLRKFWPDDQPALVDEVFR